LYPQTVVANGVEQNSHDAELTPALELEDDSKSDDEAEKPVEDMSNFVKSRITNIIKRLDSSDDEGVDKNGEAQEQIGEDFATPVVEEGNAGVSGENEPSRKQASLDEFITTMSKAVSVSTASGEKENRAPDEGVEKVDDKIDGANEVSGAFGSDEKARESPTFCRDQTIVPGGDSEKDSSTEALEMLADVASNVLNTEGANRFSKQDASPEVPEASPVQSPTENVASSPEKTDTGVSSGFLSRASSEEPSSKGDEHMVGAEEQEICEAKENQPNERNVVAKESAGSSGHEHVRKKTKKQKRHAPAEDGWTVVTSKKRGRRGSPELNEVNGHGDKPSASEEPTD
jgi:hypothetical protein